MNNQKKLLDVICLLKGKLTPLDNTTPLLLKLLKLGITKNITIIISDTTFWKLMEEEILFKYCFSKYKIKIITPQKNENKLGKFIRILAILFFFKKIFYKKIWFIGGDESGLFGKITMKINKVLFGGCLFHNNLSPYDQETLQNINRVMVYHYARQPFRLKYNKCDAIITTLPLSAYTIMNKPVPKTINLGHTRTFPEWAELMKEYYNNESNAIDSYGEYFFWPLSVLKRTEPNGESYNFSKGILKVLDILHECNCSLKVVFRYHPTTDKAEMSKILTKSKFKKTIISYEHPHLLIQKSKFIFSTMGTTLFCDAWFLNKPVVQFTPDDNMLAEKNEAGKIIASSFKPLVDHFIAYDKHKFISLLKSLEKNNGNINRNENEKSAKFSILNNKEILKEFEEYL